MITNSGKEFPSVNIYCFKENFICIFLMHKLINFIGIITRYCYIYNSLIFFTIPVLDGYVYVYLI